MLDRFNVTQWLLIAFGMVLVVVTGLSVAIPAQGRSDEVGRMAQTFKRESDSRFRRGGLGAVLGAIRQPSGRFPAERGAAFLGNVKSA